MARKQNCELPGHRQEILTWYSFYLLDSQTYEFYRTLEDLLHTNPIFGSTPANPNNNISNGALGYFGACAVSTKFLIITDSILKTVK